MDAQHTSVSFEMTSSIVTSWLSFCRSTQIQTAALRTFSSPFSDSQRIQLSSTPQHDLYGRSLEASDVTEHPLKLVNFENEAHATGAAATQEVIKPCNDNDSTEVE